MARFLAIDWDHQHLQIVAATLRRGTVQVEKAVSFEEAQNPYNAGPAVLGQLLRDRLKDAHISPAPVLACIGRDRVVVKDVRYPAVPAHEEPAIVRFQVVKEINETPDEVIIDYFSAPEQANGGDRRAFAVVARRAIVVTYREMCKEAGLKLSAMVPRPFGVAACLRIQLGASIVTPPPEPRDGAVAVLTVGKPWAEFCVVHGSAMLFARSLTAGPMLAGEVRRNLAVYAGQSPQHPVRALYVAGSDDYLAVRERVQEPLSIPVYPLDPFGGAERSDIRPELRGAFAGTMGLLQASADGTEFAVDFIKPKEPKPLRSPHRLRGLLAAAAGVALLIVGAGVCYSKLTDRDGELTRLLDDVAKLDLDLARYKDEGAKLKALESWNQSNINWLDELYDLTAQVPDLEKVRISQFIGSRLTQTSKDAKDKPVAQVDLKAITNDTKAVDEMNSRLAHEPHYRGTAKKAPDRNTGARGAKFPQQFKLHFEIEKQSPDKYERELPDATPSPERRPNRPRRGNQPGGGISGRAAP